MEEALNLEIKEKSNTKKNISKRRGKEPRYRKAIFPAYIEDFEQFLQDRNYAETTIRSYKDRGRKLCNDLMKISDISFQTLSDFRHLSNELVHKFETFKLHQIEDKKLSPTSVHSDMKAFRLFIQFLFFNNIISFRYEIPDFLLAPATRANLYVNQEDILKLAESIRKNKNPILASRNYALLLLYVETGCRAIEASNILISDINFSEKTIRLNSIKSGTRKLILNPFVIKILKDYMKKREQLIPKTNHFFLKNNGEKASSTNLTLFLVNENYKAFGMCKVNSRALRHTYVTNAFENNNEFQQISETMGHKHWVSTLHYQHRSKERLLTHTLPFNPIPEVFNNGDDKNAN